jgi:hypothetical protein
VISKKLVLIVSLCVAGSLFPVYGSTCGSTGNTLADYEAFGAGGCTIGGYNFSSFSWIPTGANPHSTPLETGVTVTNLLDSNGVGFLLTFGSPTTFFAGGGGNADGELHFVVTDLSGLGTIDRMYQQIDGTAVGGPTSGHPLGTFDDVSENYCFGSNGLPPCTPAVVPGLQSTLMAGGTCGHGTTDGAGGCKNSVSFAGVNSISVRKDIDANATAGASGANATITGVINQFGPAVPEPSTYVLSFIGLGLMFFGSRKYLRS